MAHCCSTGPGLQSVEQALELLLAAAKPLAVPEWVPLADALGRVAAAPVVSQVQVPPWDNSAMDGYAVRCADLTAPGQTLPISQRIPAGYAGAPLAPGSAARIFTGAPIPAGADAVVMQEVCVQDGDRVQLQELPSLGAEIRRAGEDIQLGQAVIAAGTRLAPQHLGLAASVGAAAIQVYRRPRVAVFSSGDELVPPGQPLGPGQIYNSNQYTLAGLIQTLGCDLIPLGSVPDNLAATQEALARGAAQADLVLASGGVSVGDEDHVRPAVERLGRLELWRIAMRPGKPLAFGHIDATPFIGFPGNPVSVFVAFCLFARPFLLKLQGVANPGPAVQRGRAAFDWPRPDRRREYARARWSQDDQGQGWIQVHPNRSSGVLSSVTWADGLAVLPAERPIQQGDPLDFIPFRELLG